MRKSSVILPIAIYVTLAGITFLTMLLVSPIFTMIHMLGYSFIAEMFLIAFLGIMWFKQEWVHGPSD